MNENRETITIETPVDKHRVVLKVWITGKEKRNLRKPILDALRLDIAQSITKIDDIKAGDLVESVENLAIETIVVSVNEVTDKGKILELVLDMKDKDYDFVIVEINKISQDLGFRKP